MIDTDGNVWFSTGGIIGSGDAVQNATIIDYIESDDLLNVHHCDDEMIENGIAVTGTIAFAATGTSDRLMNAVGALGFLWVLKLNQCCGVEVVWKVSYPPGQASSQVG